MTVFVLNTNVISGHEKMFLAFYELYQGDKTLLNLKEEGVLSAFKLLAAKNRLIISAGYPAQNLFLILFYRIFFKKINIYTPFGFHMKYFRVNSANLKEFVYKLIVFGRRISFTTCSEEQKAYLIERFPSRSVFSLNNFIQAANPPQFSKPNGNRVFFIGRVDQTQKNCLFFEPLSRLIKNEINLVGECVDKDLEVRLKNSNIHLLGKQPNPYQLLSTNDCIVLPSFYEGAALVVIEACYQNIPIILSDCVGNRSITSNAIFFNTPEDASELLASCFNSDKFFIEKWNYFRESVKNNYCRDQFVKQLNAFEYYYNAI